MVISTQENRCNECKRENIPMVEFWEEDTFEERTFVWLCLSCLRAAVQMLEQAQEEQPRHNYTGPINVGDRFIWEPTQPDARQRIVVTEAKPEWVQSEGENGGCYWNEESRFREAVVKDLLT